MFGVLRIRDYRLLAAGQMLPSFGDWLLLVAAPDLAADETSLAVG